MTAPPPPNRPYLRADEGADLLVVEDSPVTLEFLRFALEDYGYRVRCATTVATGLGELGTRLPDLVVLDLLLPDAPGLEICRQLRAYPAGEDVPILIITVDANPKNHAEAVRAGADDFLRKPILAPELQTRVRSLLRLRRLRRELRADKDAILGMQVQKEEMVQFVLHDMKNMLTSLLTGVELLEDDPSPAGWPEHKRRIGLAARGLQAMVGDFLDLSLASEAKPRIRKEALELEPWLKQAVGEFGNFGSRRPHVFQVDWEGPGTVLVDPQLLRRALFNLLDNARRYAPEGSAIRVSAGPAQEGRWQLAVADHGPGIPDALKARIFSRLFQVEQADRAHVGKGLGLAFCNLVAELHGGSLKVEDVQPHGTRFTFLLPA